MELNRARTLALDLMKQHGVQNWTFRFDSAQRRMGVCNYTRRTISLSRFFVTSADEDAVRDTILHEIAHALTPGHNHGPVWKQKVAEIGGTPSRTGHNPHYKQLRNELLPEELRDLEPDLTLRQGEFGVAIAGGPRIAGQRVEVVERGRTRYTIKTPDGTLYKIAMQAVARSPEPMQARPVTPAAQPKPTSGAAPLLRPGRRGVILYGSYRGTVFTVDKIARTSYHGRTAAGGLLRVPFPLAAPEGTPLPVIRPLRKGEHGVIAGDGRYGGQKVTIDTVGSVNYVVRLDDLGLRIRVPKEMVVPA